jgi:hypothetical protein
VTPSGAPARHPFTVHGNAVVAQALEVFRRTLDEESAKEVEDPEAVRAAIVRHFSVAKEGKQVFAASADLANAYSLEDDPAASVLWLPLFEAVQRTDSTYRRTVKSLPEHAGLLAYQCARLLGPDAATVLQWLRRAPLYGGVAAEFVDDEGRATANAGDAALAGLVAYMAWYAVHAIGIKPE